MKNTLILLFAGLGLISCTGEDAAIVQPNPEPIMITVLDTVKFNNGDVMVFDNNKLQQHLIGTKFDGSYDLKYNYIYGPEGDLTALTGQLASGEIYFERSVAYDEQGRIILKNDVTNNSSQGTTLTETVAYTYNDTDNTVYADYSQNDTDSNADRTYYFNTAGRVTKVTNNSGQVLQEMTYTGDNITALNGVQVVYDMDTPVKGEFLNIYSNSFNSYRNFVLYSGYVVAGTVAKNYITTYDESPGTLQDQHFIYEFNEEGYPLKMTATSQAGAFTEAIIIYKQAEM